jgi:hypothetical protein
MPQKHLPDDLTIPESLRTPESLAAIVEWLEYKRVSGHGYKRASFFAKKLAEFSTPESLISAVNHSIGNNYQGLFAPRNGRQSDDDPRGNLALAQRMLGKLRK